MLSWRILKAATLLLLLLLLLGVQKAESAKAKIDYSALAARIVKGLKEERATLAKKQSTQLALMLARPAPGVDQASLAAAIKYLTEEAPGGPQLPRGTVSRAASSSNAKPSGWRSEPAAWDKELKSTRREKKVTTEQAFVYPKGLGPALMNDCTQKVYSLSSPCYRSKATPKRIACNDMLEAAAYIGVGFNGRGFYSARSRRASLIQRSCANRFRYKGQSVPDVMNVFGVYETSAETTSFQSASEYMRYTRHKAGLSNQKGLFTSEASKYSEGSSNGFSLGTVGMLVGAYYGGPAGAQMGQALGASISADGGDGSGSMSSKKRSSKRSSRIETQTSSRTEGSQHNFFAIMYVNVIQYEITLDDVKPTDISLDALRDFMHLPVSYYSPGADVKYQNFVLRWGTHFVRSAKFGGQLQIKKTCNTKKVMTAQQFARIAETEFQSMLATLSSKYSQETSGFTFLGFGTETKTSRQRSKFRVETESKRKTDAKEENSQKSRHSEFTQTSVEAMGGNPEIAESLLDFYTPAFKQRFHNWLQSINEQPKPFNFQLKSVHDLFNINMDDIFPEGNIDFGCSHGGNGSARLHQEGHSGRWYYIDSRQAASGNETVEQKVRVYCKYTTLERRRMSLEKAIGVYMTEGPFPTSSQELPAGETGCEENALSALNLNPDIATTLKFVKLKSQPFLLTFDLPKSIPGIVSMQAKFRVVYRSNRWYATDPLAPSLHLYEGCRAASPTGHKICFRNIILTYNENSSLLHIDRNDFLAAKRRIPSLPSWLSGSTVARAQPLQSHTKKGVKDTIASGRISVPCQIRWLNSHRLDPNRNESCVHFTAASEGDIFVVFASIPKNRDTWYYLQISQAGVKIYKGFQLLESFAEPGIGHLGDKNLFQSYFVCVTQRDTKLIMQYGKAESDSEIGKVYASHTSSALSRFARLSFYSFGSGERPVSLMDIRLTKRLPNADCVNSDHKKVDGHCVLDCHQECDGCRKARNAWACKKCKNVRLHHGRGSSLQVQCLPRCPAGYQPDRSKRCLRCPVGQFKEAAGNHNCSDCRPGSYAAATGSSKCNDCQPGTFNDKFGRASASDCRRCLAGTFAAQHGTSRCSRCERGSFQPAKGQTACKLADRGHYVRSKGRRGQVSCGRGRFALSRGAVRCRRCPAGRFADAAGRTVCTPCPRGRFARTQGSSRCQPCEPGKFANRTGSAGCVDCPIGSFMNVSGQSRCDKCEAGTFSDAEGQTQCKQCRIGFWSKFGSSGCYQCGRGPSRKKSRHSNYFKHCRQGAANGGGGGE